MRIMPFASMVLAFAVAGCGYNPLPPTEQIDQIRLTVNTMPGENPAVAKPRQVTLKERADVLEVMDWLNSIDWSQSGQDMAVIGIPQPDGTFTLIDKSAATHSYSFYWDGKFVNSKANRLIKGGDPDKLKKLVERVVKAP
jgi:hypothetical protein